MARRLLSAAAALGLALAAAGCGGSASTAAVCAGGPKSPGVQASLSAGDQTFAASDVNNLSRRFYAAGATCVSVDNPGERILEVREQGLTGARAHLLLGRGSLALTTWKTPLGAGSSNLPFVVNPSQVPTADGGSCAASTPRLACFPNGYSPRPIGVDSGMITSVSVRTGADTRQPEIVIALNDTGTSILAQATQALPPQSAPLNQLAVFVDDTMFSNVTVVAALTRGQVVVKGGAIGTEPHLADDLAVLIRTGTVNPFTVASQSDLK